MSRERIPTYRLEIIREMPKSTTTTLGGIKSFFMKPDKKGGWCEKSKVRYLEDKYAELEEKVKGLTNLAESVIYNLNQYTLIHSYDTELLAIKGDK